MLPEYEKQRIKNEIEYCKESPVQILIIDNVEHMISDTITLLATSCTTYEEAIDEIDRSLKFIKPDLQDVANIIGRLIKARISKIAHSKEFISIFEGVD